jgi:hypothetical protein
MGTNTVNDSTSSHLISHPQLHSCSLGPCSHASNCSNGPTKLWLWPLLILSCPRPKPTHKLKKPKRGVHRCRVRGCRSVRKTTRACISHGACMQGALHLFTQPRLCKLPNYYHYHHQKPSIQQYVATRRTTLHPQQILDLEASVCRMGGTDFCILPLIMLTAPDSAVTVVVRHHPIEAPLQLSRLRRVFHLLCVPASPQKQTNTCDRGLQLLQCSTAENAHDFARVCLNSSPEYCSYSAPPPIPSTTPIQIWSSGKPRVTRGNKKSFTRNGAPKINIKT